MATIQLARSQSVPRQFPPISTDFYQKDHPLLRLIDAPLTHAQHYGSNPLTGSLALTRLLIVHCEAMQAEVGGDWSTATYLWGHVLAEAKALHPRSELWADFGGDSTRFAFYTEILADTHLAFYNGCIEFVSTQVRAKYHQALAEDYMLLAGISRDEIASMKNGALDRQIVKGWGAQDWQAVFDACEAVLATSVSDPYAELCARAGFNLVTTKLGKVNSSWEALRDIGIIDKSLRAVQRVSARQPYNSLWYEYLALLYHLLAIRQFNADQMAQALATERKALTYQPELSMAEQSLASMRTEMGKLAQQLKTAQASLRPGMSLSAQGHNLATQIRLGNSLEEQFRKSNEATRIAREVRVARGATVWRRMNIPDPTEKREDTWIALSDQLNNFSKERTPIVLIATLWSSIVAVNPLLSPITADKLMAYIQTYMSANPAPQEPIQLPQVSEGGVAQRLPAKSKLAKTPLRASEAPFAYWWQSTQSRLVKGLLAAGAILIIVGAGAYLYGQNVETNRIAQVASAQAARQTAYNQLIAAVNAGDNPAVLDAAEAFYANLTASAHDSRLSQVDQLYNRALVDWVLKTSPAQPEIDARVSRYHALRGTT